jgi:hypothetical protein
MSSWFEEGKCLRSVELVLNVVSRDNVHIVLKSNNSVSKMLSFGKRETFDLELARGPNF